MCIETRILFSIFTGVQLRYTVVLVSAIHQSESVRHIHVCMLSRLSYVQLFATLWTVAPPHPLSMEFSRQEYWNGLSCPPPEDLPDPGIEPMSLNISHIGRQVLYH